MLLTCIFKSKGLKLNCGIVKAQEIEKVNDKEGGKVRRLEGEKDLWLYGILSKFFDL